MGSCNSKNEDDDNLGAHKAFHHIDPIQAVIQKSARIPFEIQVAHFTPAFFPMVPIINPKGTKICQTTWMQIVSGDIRDQYGGVVSGMTIFYNEFYERLGATDTSGSFDVVLNRHCSGMNKIAAKGAILMRVVSSVLKLDSACLQNQRYLRLLGKSHAKKQIRPWQYSVFVQVLLLTISSRLGSEATNNVMEAWVHLFAFVLQCMLPPALIGNVDEHEYNVNTCERLAAVSTKIMDAPVERSVSSKPGKGAGGGGGGGGGGGAESAKTVALSSYHSASLSSMRRKLDD